MDPTEPEVMTTLDRTAPLGEPPLESSFEEFYARHREPIGRALALTLRDDALAADALDEAMVRAFERWNQVADLANPAGWVYRVALNWARSVVRRLTRPVRAPRAFEVVSSSHWFDPDVERALRQLTVEQRAVVVCRFYIGYSEAETADALGIRPGTVKSRLSRALEVLRTSTHLEEERR